jgi:hypothetical protein
MLSDRRCKWAVKLVEPQSAAKFAVIVPQPVEGEPEVAAVTPPPVASDGNKLVSSILEEFSDVFSGVAEMPPARQGVEHRIITEGRPVSARYCRLDAEKLMAAKKEFLELERISVVRR